MRSFPFWMMLIVAVGLEGEARAESFEQLQQRARDLPKDPEAALELARALRRSGLNDRAILAARTAFARARGREIVSRLRLEIARNHVAQRDQKQALRECSRIEKLSQARYHLCNAEAQLLRRRGSLALPEAEAALAAEPGSYDALVAKGRALQQLGRPKEAEATLQAAIAAEPAAPEAYLGLAELYQHESKDAAALEALERAESQAPGDPAVLVALARLLPAGQRAVSVLERAISVRPDDAEALALLGKLQLDASNVPAAQEALERALKLDPKDADSHALMGRVHLAEGRPAEALAAARRASSIVPNHAAAKLVEAMALAESGDIDLAIPAFEAAYGLARLDPEPLVRAALACLDGDRPTTARAFAERATRDFPDWAPGWAALGDVAQATGERKLARESYERALDTKGPIDAAAIRRKLARLE